MLRDAYFIPRQILLPFEKAAQRKILLARKNASTFVGGSLTEKTAIKLFPALGI